MKLTFYGAARQVTGSMFLLESDSGYRILIDCGVDFSPAGNDPVFPFDPSTLDVVVLTHAHLDHSGNVPRLYEYGYQGQVICTSGTLSLVNLLLADAAAIKSKGIRRKLQRRRFEPAKIGEEENERLDQLVQDAMERFVPIAYDKSFEISDGISVTLVQAGHLLGAANVLIEVKEDGKSKKIGFSGDLGRKNYPLLKDPDKLSQVDYLVCETTYGSREHSDKEDAEELMRDIIHNACVRMPGRLIIPSFSVGRTQSLLYTMHKLAVKKKLPEIKVFADSPMAERATRIYEEHVKELNKEAGAFYDENRTLFNFENLICIKTWKESKELNNYMEPCVIISSSGMLTGGRMPSHIRKNLDNQYCTILQVGFMAEGTPGASLLSSSFIRIKGKKIPVQANIIGTDVFSGHADRHDLLDFVKVQDKSRLNGIFLVHGEYDSMISFKKDLEKEGYKNIEIPKKGESFIL